MAEKFPKRLKAARERTGLLQKELAGKVGVSRSTVASWESDASPNYPEARYLERIAAALVCSVDYLLGHSDTPAISEEPSPYRAEDLALRWPNLSPDRRRRAADMERDAKAQGIQMHLGRGLTDDEFDALLRDVAVFAAFVAGQKTAPRKMKE
ncbi:MAG: helix-turn-helix domain-containing protein [Symbiobacteriia bacterium]